jgi:hypothetical protein
MTSIRSAPDSPVRLLASLFLVSAATLTFEINLSRLFSVAQFYHFAFMIVSLALLGFGASGTFLALFPEIGRKRPARGLSALAAGAAASMLASYLLINWLPFDSFSMAWDRRQVGILALHYVGLALPFFFSGAAVGMLLRRFPSAPGRVYAVNLIGSATGCLAALAAPTFLGGEGTVVLSSALAACAGIFTFGAPRKALAHFMTRVLLLLNLGGLGWQALTGAPIPLLKLQLSPYKSLSYALQVPGAETLMQRWNTFARLDLVRSEGIRSMPGISIRYASPPPPQHGIFIDGDNLSPVVLPNADLAFTDALTAALAYELRPGARTLILEPVGGLDVLTAIHQGAGKITAVEPNPLVIEAAGHIYLQPQVETVRENGRSYLRRSGEHFDIVLFSLSEAYHPVRSGAYSLAEDYRYTLEAFLDALDRLEEDGILVVPRWLQIPPSEFLRAFIMAATALEQNRLDASERIAALRSFNTGLLLVKKTPFTPDELETVRRFSASQAFDLVYLPGIQPDETNRYNILREPIYYQAFTGFLGADPRQAWLEAYPYDVSPPTDHHPFFGHYFKWSQAPQILTELGKSWQPFGGAGYFVVFVLLALAVLSSAVIILLPLAFWRHAMPHRRITAVTFVYFSLLGLAFLLVEIPLIQRFILYLGHPAYAFTISLFSILLFSGMGSQNAERFTQWKALGALILLVATTPWTLPWLFNLTLGFPLATRMALAVLALAPLGFLMGMPFPQGISRLASLAPELIAWAWGVNGAFSVIASILAALIALSLGFRWTLLAGAACYAGVWMMAVLVKDWRHPPGG